MFKNFYKSNIHLLEKRDKSLTYLLSSNLSANINHFETKNKSITIKYCDKLIHSIYDPQSEAAGFIEKTEIETDGLLVVYGFGLGYHIEAAINKLGNQGKILVVEANLTLLSAAFKLRDLKNILSDERVTIISSDNQKNLARLFSNELSKNAVNEDKRKVAVHAPSLNIIPAGFEKIQNSFEILLIERRFDTVFGPMEKINFSNNRAIIVKSDSAKTYFNKFSNRGGILISAGPSLDCNIHYLKALKKKFILVCVDTAFPALISEGIDPDFIVTVDPQDKSFIHFTSSLSKRIPLLCLPTSNSKVLSSYSGKKIIIYQDKKEIETPCNKVITKTGGSVSCLALDFLIKTGTNPIILTGQDCTFSDGYIYSSKTAMSTEICRKITRINTANEQALKRISAKKSIYVKNIYGFDSKTHQNLYSYLRYIENIISKNPENTFYNLGSKGADIKGAVNISSPYGVISNF